MDIQIFTRRSFEVEAVQLTLNNIDEVAAWCGATTEMRPTKMMKTEVLLPVINLKGVGNEHMKYFIGHLNCWVVRMNKQFRIYKPEQFEKTFTSPTDADELEALREQLATAKKMLEMLGLELPEKKHKIEILNTQPLSERVNGAIDQALEIARQEIDTHNSECEV